MKKLMLLTAVLMVLAAPSAMAQKFNESAYTVKMAKSDADSADAKKAEKATTWLGRARIYAESILEPTKSLFSNLGEDMLPMILGGEPTEVEEGQNGTTIMHYPWVDVYTKARKVVGWEQTRQIKEGSFAIVKEALAKAYELDPKTADKVKEIAQMMVNFYSQQGSACIEIAKYKKAAEAYVNAAAIQELPVFEKVEPQYFFFAGQLLAFMGAEDASAYVEGEKYLSKAKDLGYMDENGNLYYFLFHCYYGQKAQDKSKVLKAKDTLLEGIAKFPKNERILDGLMQLYTSDDNVGDPADLVALIDKAIAETPDNVDLWFGRGRVFFKLKNMDECIASFKKIDELKPNDYDTNFYLGYFNIAKGDELNRAFNKNVENMKSQEEYDKALKEVIDAYMLAVPYFEKAHALKPDNLECAQSLKELCFRVRNEPGMMDKYNKYNADFKKLKGIQ